MPDISRIRSLSPAALRIFKEQAQQKARNGDPNYSRLVSMPELSDIFNDRALPTKPKANQLATAVNYATTPLRWIDQNVTKPFGAGVTSPFTPGVPGTEGMGFLQRERAEYEQWKEPEFTMPWGGKFRPTKGAVEALPWLAVPGIGGVGAKVTGIGAKGIAGALGKAGQAGRIAGQVLEYSPYGLAEKATGKVLEGAGKVAGATIGKVIPKAPIVEESMAKTSQWNLPSDDLLNTAYKQDNTRRFALWAKDKPVIGSLVKTIGGERILINPESDLAEDVVRKAVINRARLQEIGVNMQGANMPRLTNLGNPSKILGITEDGVMQTAMPKAHAPGGASTYLNDVLEHPDAYNFTTPQAGKYIQEFIAMRKEVGELLEKEGLKQSAKVHRIVKGIVTEDGRYVESKFGSDPSLARIYETQEESALAHLKKGQKIVYGTNPNEIMQYEFDRAINRISRKRFADTVGKLGKTAKERFDEIYPEKAKDITRLGERLSAAKNALSVIQRVISYKGTSVPGATMAKMKQELPELAPQLEKLYELRPPVVTKILGQMSKEITSAIKTNPKEMKFAVKTIRDIQETWRGQSVIKMADIEDALKSLNLDADIEASLITNAYKEASINNKNIFKTFLKDNKETLNRIIDTTKESARPLRTDRYKFLQGYAGREHLPHAAGEVAERPFNAIPEFRGKFFDDSVASYLEKHYYDDGTKWLQAMGNVGAMSRNLTAVLDDSAPFIQGLFTFGRSPKLWAKSTLQQFRFLVQPDNFTQYMSKPENQALHAEMVKYGSTVQRFETFEAMPQIEKAVSKIPKVGSALQKAGQETYGRAEAAFTGFGQVARDNLWKSLRRPNMSEGELQELARSIDLMTGNLSTRAMGVATSQRDFESAFVFFSPRFTRASIAFVGDMFKGGIAGAEARKSIAGLAVSGTSMYMAAATALGQEPDLDPSSGKFMTLKIGDEHVGVGGTVYSLTRLAGNLATVDNPSDLLRLDRFDNPFVKFMYSKAAPLTGLGVGAIEQADYMGRPFENIGDWSRFLAEKVVPFSVQPLISKDEQASPLGVAAQVTGLRQFPKSTYELRDEERQRIAQRDYQGADYTSLTKYDQNKIDKSPELVKLSTKLKTEGRETPESLAWDNWNTTGEQIEETYRKAVTMASRKFDAFGDGAVFKDEVDEAKSNRRALYAQRAINPQYVTIQDYFNLPKSPEELSRMNPLDIARGEFYKQMYSPEMYNEYGDYNFTLADTKESQFRQMYGQEALDYVEKFSGSKWDEPQNLKNLNQAKKILEPYFEIETQIWSQYPQDMEQAAKEIEIIGRTDKYKERQMLSKYPQIVYIRKMIAYEKLRLKMQNPQMAQALKMFYSF